MLLSDNEKHTGSYKGLKPLVQYDCGERPFHITWVTHNSRTSQRMTEFNVKKGEAVFLSPQQEVEISAYIFKIAEEKNLKIISYNICADHVHLLIVCKESELDNIVCALKSKSTYLYKKNNNITEPVKIWAQKYNCSYIETEEKLYNSINYIKDNRKKHSLSENPELTVVIDKMLQHLYI